jgi:hypothetical protein
VICHFSFSFLLADSEQPLVAFASLAAKGSNRRTSFRRERRRKIGPMDSTNVGECRARLGEAKSRNQSILIKALSRLIRLSQPKRIVSQFLGATPDFVMTGPHGKLAFVSNGSGNNISGYRLTPQAGFSLP